MTEPTKPIGFERERDDMERWKAGKPYDDKIQQPTKPIDDELGKSKIDWSTPYDGWLLPLLNDFRYGGPLVCRAIPSAIQEHIERLITADRRQPLDRVEKNIKRTKS